MFASLEKTLAQLPSAPFRSVLWRSLGLTIALYIIMGAAMYGLFVRFAELPWPWLETLAGILAGLGMVVGMVFLLVPITSLFAGLFLDIIAAAVEERYYPLDPPGRDLPLAQSIPIALKFTAVVIGVNILVLLLLLLPGVNLIAFYIGNGYLLGREYFEMAGLRHLPYDEVRALRERNRLRVFLAGTLVALLISVPILNLLAPLFATALMTHQFKQAQARSTPFREEVQGA